MNKGLAVSLIVTAAIICFAISIYVLVSNEKIVRPEVTVETMPANQVVNWYTSLPLADAESVSNAFTSETGIGVQIVRDSALVIRQKLLAEIQSDSSEADLLTIADIGTFIELKNIGALMRYDSPFYNQYPAIFQDPGYWAVFAGFGICMAYNENSLDLPPQHWEDLLQDRWKGRIGLEDINTAGSQYGQYYMLRDLLGLEFWHDLLTRQKPRIYFQTSDLAQALIKGEIDVAGEFSTNTVYNYRVKKGNPLQGIYPTEGVPFVVNPIAIMKKAKHPDEAKIFFNYVLSHRGQSIMQNTNFKYSVVSDITPLNGLPPLNALKVLLPENADQYSSKRDQYINEYGSLLEEGQ
jgi:iron(III) transport system substrate-binding protein